MPSSKEDDLMDFLRSGSGRQTAKAPSPSLYRPVATVATPQFTQPRRLSPVVRTVKHSARFNKRKIALIILAVVVVGVVVFALVVAPLLNNAQIASGNGSSSHLVFSGSFIHVNTAAGSGEVFVKIYNEGTGSVSVRSVMISREEGAVAITFPDEHCGSLNCAVKGDPGAGVLSPGELLVPAGDTVTVDYSYESIALFQPATSYQATLSIVGGGDIQFAIPSESAP